MALNPLDPIVRDLAEVKRQLAGRSQLNHSSLENTAIPVYDGEGTERLRIGAQDDGTHAIKYVQGPPPPRPTAPIVSVDGPVVRVRWDGILMGGHIPEDFSRIDVHFALASDDIEEASAVRANLATAAGSEATLMATATGTYRVGLVAMSQSRARSEMSETVEVEVQVVDLATAIETAAQSANGKNTVTYSQRSPEPTDEGSDGDTWWVNEARPRDPEDPAAGVVIAIIEQWQHAAGVWVQVEMAHEVIASVDLGRATVGYLHGQRIEAGSIDTEQLEFGAATGDILAVDALNFKRAVGLDLVSSSFRAGDAVEITEDFGIRQFGPDGSLNVSLPSDGSEAQFRGDLSARTLTATGRMAIQGPGAIASGGVLELESGVVAPISAPQVSNTWARVTMPPLTNQEQAAGLAWGEGHWWRLITTTVGLSDGGRTRVEKIDPDGNLVGGFNCSFRVDANGITYLNGELYLLVHSRFLQWDGPAPDRAVVVYNTNGVEQRRWEYPSYGTGTYQPGIGTHGTSIAIAQCWSSGELSWRLYQPNGSLFTRVDTGVNVAADVKSLYSGRFDFDNTRIVVGLSRQSSTKPQVLVFRSGLVSPPLAEGEAWYAADYAEIRGLAWNGTQFHSLQPNGNLAKYEPLEAGRIYGNDERGWWIALGWASTDGSARTPAGPAAEFRFLKRARHTATIRDVPEGVDRVRLYYANTPGTPTRGDLHYTAHTGADSRLVWMNSLLSTWANGANPPVTNLYGASTPGEIRSSIGTYRVDGSGAGEWGPLRFGADGSLRGAGTVITGQVEHPSITAGNLNSHDVTITFPSGRFTSPPVIMLSHTNGLVSPVPAADTVTKDSFQLRVWNPHETRNAGSGTVYWAAIERST